MSNGTTTTYFVGSHYEVANGVITKYYFAGTQRIALRSNGTLNYLLGDHLGSTSLTTDANGQVISELRYKPWGETRYASGTTPTKYTFTGQYSYAGEFGLHFYNARWYDSSLSRFASADTVVPGGVQGYDRYAYVNNSPVNYTDPTGHRCADGDEDIWGYCNYRPPTNTPSQRTMGIWCGSQGDGNNEGLAGPPCTGGTKSTNQMSIWVSNTFGYPMWNVEYPGDHDVSYATDEQLNTPLFTWNIPSADRRFNSNAGASGQALLAQRKNPDPSADAILICYSVGSLSCLIYANQNTETVVAVVLMGPGFDGYDSNLTHIDSFQSGWDTKIDSLANENISVLVVDDSNLTGQDASNYPGVDYYPSGIGHLDMDDDIGLMNYIFTWISENTSP